MIEEILHVGVGGGPFERGFKRGLGLAIPFESVFAAAPEKPNRAGIASVLEQIAADRQSLAVEAGVELDFDLGGGKLGIERRLLTLGLQ